MDAWPLALFILLLFLNVPVTVAIGAGALLFFLHQRGLPLTIFPQRLSAFSQSFPLVAIPMFTFAGVIMNHSGITTRLLNLAETLVGHMSGALAQTNVLLATLMGFESGSGNADAAMQSKMLGAQMVRRGYPRPFAAAIVAASAVITPMMPPGLGFVLYGYLANVSVGRLFMAGIVPGFTMMPVLMVTTYFLSKRYGFQPVRDRMASPAEILAALRQASWALTVPFVVIFGLRYGIFTPTEAGAVIATYSLAVGLFVYRELKVSQLWGIVTEAALATAIVMMIISAANALGYYMTLEQIASHVATTLSSITTNPLLMLVVINLFLLGRRHGAGERRGAHPADPDSGADRQAGRHRSRASGRADLAQRDTRRRASAGRDADVHHLRRARREDHRLYARRFCRCSPWSSRCWRC